MNQKAKCDAQDHGQKYSGIQNCEASIEGSALGSCATSDFLCIGEFVPQAFQVLFGIPIPTKLQNWSQAPENTTLRFLVRPPASFKILSHEICSSFEKI